MALHAMGKLDDALDAYSKGLELDPNNAQLNGQLNQLLRDKQA
jgi:cytochrome c-type biogenesis protein CcmH/NrfG